MKRKAINDLINWKNKKKRKPLLIFGARQVGKTYLVKQFADEYFDNSIYINFETNSLVSDIIKDNIEPLNIIKNLEIIFNQKIDPEKTLIFFDEIQENPRALTSLKYFCEEAPDYHIIGAGSLLGVHIKREDFSFPVGKVETLNIYPLSFDEFLINNGNEMLLNEIVKCYKENTKISNVMHQKALSLYRDYLTIGGMPKVVDRYIQTNSFIEALDIQSEIIISYRNDITKYATPSLATKILATFDSIPNQLAKDNKKFQYKIVQNGGTSTIFGESISWLINAGITLQCVKSKVGVPLKLYEELESFKLYMTDVGLLTNISKFPLYLIQNQEAVNDMMIGMLTENYVASCLKFNGIDLRYWKNDATSKVDFLLQSSKGKIIPVEVKTSSHTKSRSLNNYITTYNPEYSIRISSKNFSFVNKIKSVPLYATFCITENSLDEI